MSTLRYARDARIRRLIRRGVRHAVPGSLNAPAVQSIAYRVKEAIESEFVIEDRLQAVPGVVDVLLAHSWHQIGCKCGWENPDADSEFSDRTHAEHVSLQLKGSL